MARKTSKPRAKVFGRHRLNVSGEVYDVPVNLIDPAPYNPKSRSDPKETKNKNLAKSIARKGQIIPVHLMLSKDGARFEMEEGHRRLCATKDILGLSTIRAVITPYDPTSNNAAERWQAIADEVSKIDSAGRLWAYLSNPLTASKKMGEKFAKMIRLIGRPLVERIAKAGKGWDFYNGRCIQVAKFMGLGEKEYRSFVEYVLTTPEAETECRKLYEASLFEECERKVVLLTSYNKRIAPHLCDCKQLVKTEVNVRVHAAA
jgi:hypothetical protein